MKISVNTLLLFEEQSSLTFPPFSIFPPKVLLSVHLPIKSHMLLITSSSYMYDSCAIFFGKNLFLDIFSQSLRYTLNIFSGMNIKVQETYHRLMYAKTNPFWNFSFCDFYAQTISDIKILFCNPHDHGGILKKIFWTPLPLKLLKMEAQDVFDSILKLVVENSIKIIIRSTIVSISKLEFVPLHPQELWRLRHESGS